MSVWLGNDSIYGMNAITIKYVNDMLMIFTTLPNSHDYDRIQITKERHVNEGHSYVFLSHTDDSQDTSEYLCMH